MSKINVKLDAKAKNVIQKTANFSGGSGDIKVVDELPSTKKDSLYIKRNTTVIPPLPQFKAHRYDVMMVHSSYSQLHTGQFLVVKDGTMKNVLKELIAQRWGWGEKLPDTIYFDYDSLNIITEEDWNALLQDHNPTLYYITSEEDLLSVHTESDTVFLQDLGEFKFNDMIFNETIGPNSYPESHNVYDVFLQLTNSLAFTAEVDSETNEYVYLQRTIEVKYPPYPAPQGVVNYYFGDWQQTNNYKYLGTLTDEIFTDDVDPEEHEIYRLTFSPQSTETTYEYDYQLYVFDKGEYREVK